jgi:RimJ/RimL family protein N-acetyltransferase
LIALALETERLRLEGVREQDLPDVLEVFDSNPEYREWTEGGDYDIAKLQRDWHVAQITPGREMLALRDRDSGEVAGVVEYLERNDHDGHPWIGLIMVRADRQRAGLAGEAMEAVCSRLADNWLSPVRLGVIDRNTAGLGLAISLGFEQYGETEQQMGAGPVRLVLMERR